MQYKSIFISCTALIETLEGEWKIIYWDKHEKD